MVQISQLGPSIQCGRGQKLEIIRFIVLETCHL